LERASTLKTALLPTPIVSGNWQLTTDNCFYGPGRINTGCCGGGGLVEVSGANELIGAARSVTRLSFVVFTA
jgi:hypothetical protein